MNLERIGKLAQNLVHAVQKLQKKFWERWSACKGSMAKLVPKQQPLLDDEAAKTLQKYDRKGSSTSCARAVSCELRSQPI